MDDLELGGRIAYWRERRGFTQKLLADRIGRSKSWIEKVEAGTRSADRLPILLTICNELRVDLPALIGRDPNRETRECIDDVQVEMIRGALERYDIRKDEVSIGRAPDMIQTQRQLVYIWSAFEQGDYYIVSQHLPALLLDAQWNYALEARDDATAILSEVYQITASTLRKLGEYDLAWLAGDRGLTLAERLGDSVLTALIGFRVANALTALGRSKAAFDLNLSLASQVEVNTRTAADRSVYGNLLLQGAMAAASNGNASAVRDLIREAEAVAAHVPNNANHHHLSFGLTNVAIHHVSALVSLGEGALAVEIASKIDGQALRSIRRERRANHLVDVARGYSQWGMRDEALGKLLEAEALAPKEVICRPMARNTIENLIGRTRNQPSRSLRALAERAGVNV
jgi:transcriptional regulator with XRE-family HTH domain